MSIERARAYARALPARIGFELREHIPPLGQRRYRRFCIVSPGRAGSQMLVQRCDSHPRMRCFGEVLGPDYINWQTANRPEMNARFLAARKNDPFRFLERHVWHPYGPGIRAVGFKIVYSQLLYWRSVMEPLIKSGLSILWLNRRNTFELCLSRIIARETKVYRLEPAGTTPEVGPVTIDAKIFERSFKLLEVAQATIAEILQGSRCISLYYEDLVERPEPWNSRICAFLEVEDRALVHSSKKLAGGPLRERVANYDELRAHFRGTRWECHFADD